MCNVTNFCYFSYLKSIQRNGAQLSAFMDVFLRAQEFNSRVHKHNSPFASISQAKEAGHRYGCSNWEDMVGQTQRYALGCHLDVQRWDQESESRDGVELGQACEKHYEGILQHTDQKRNAKQTVTTLIKGKLATVDMEKAEELATYLPQSSVAVGLPMFLTSLNLQVMVEGKKILPTVTEEHQSMIHPEPMLMLIIITSSQRKMQAAITFRSSQQTNKQRNKVFINSCYDMWRFMLCRTFTFKIYTPIITSPCRLPDCEQCLNNKILVK